MGGCRDRERTSSRKKYKKKARKFIISIVKVIDAPCGVGKTSWAIQNINEHENESYIFCTPFLGEIERIREQCGWHRFREPLPYNGTKIDDFNELLSTGGDIAVSHITFLNATQETLELIRTGKYTLIIDEALDVVTEFNKVQSVENAPRQTITKDDIKMLLERNIIQIADDYRVKWCGGEYGTGCKFSEVERFSKLNRLYCVRDKLLLTVFPPEMFACFDNVYILTYMFEGSTLKYYFELFNIDYKLMSISCCGEEYRLTEYTKQYDIEFRRKCKKLVSVCDNKNMNRYRRGTLSKTWYSNSGNDNRLKELKNDLCNYFNRYLKGAKASNGDIMWTCIGGYENLVKGQGYTRIRNLNEQEKKLPEDKRKEVEKMLTCFVPCNSKATNVYRERWALAYCVNMFFNPMIKGFFEDHNEQRAENKLSQIKLNEDLFALSCLIQWIFRSRIRDGEPIEIYIPNTRMRELFTRWLNNEI